MSAISLSHSHSIVHFLTLPPAGLLPLTLTYQGANIFMRYRETNRLPCESSHLVMETKSRPRTQTKGVVIHPHISFRGFSHDNKMHFQGPTDSLLSLPLETFQQFSLSFSLSLPTLKAHTLIV